MDDLSRRVDQGIEILAADLIREITQLRQRTNALRKVIARIENDLDHIPEDIKTSPKEYVRDIAAELRSALG